MPRGDFTIHVIGSMMIDRVVRVREIPRPGETVAAEASAVFPGGKGANQAAAAALCGARVRMLGRTGADGAFIRDALRDAGVHTGSVVVSDPVSGAATVMVSRGGENAIVIAPESNRRVAAVEVERFLAGARHGDIALFQNECSALHEGIAVAAMRGLRVWLNAAPADDGLRGLRFDQLDGLVVNETEAEALTGLRDPARALERLAERMPAGTVVVTLGARGAIVAAGAARFEHRGFEVDAVDTVGCGDAFVGAFVAAIAEQRTVTYALARGNAAGALAAMVPGAMPSLPSREEVTAVAMRAPGARIEAGERSVAGGVPQRCEACGYRLVGKRLGDDCPECGRRIREAVLGGRWIDPVVRRRFRLASWLLLGGASFLVLFVGVLAFSLRRSSPVAEVVAVVSLIAWTVASSAGTLIAAHSHAAARRWSPASIGGALRIGGVGFVVTVLALQLGWWGQVVGIAGIAGVAASDLVFAWSIGRFACGTRISPVPRARLLAIRWVGAGAVAMLCWSWLELVLVLVLFRTGRSNDLLLIALALWAAFHLLTAIELVRLVRRMPVAERRP